MSAEVLSVSASNSSNIASPNLGGGDQALTLHDGASDFARASLDRAADLGREGVRDPGAMANGAALRGAVTSLETVAGPVSIGQDKWRRREWESIGDVLANRPYGPLGLAENIAQLDMEGSLDDVLAASVRVKSGAFDVSTFERVMTRVASLRDADMGSGWYPGFAADLKASVFAKGVNAMRELGRGPFVVGGTIDARPAAARMIGALSKVLDSDTTGVMRHLAADDSPTRDGAAFAVYAKQMLLAGREEKLGEFMVRLQTGNSQNENQIKRLVKTENAAGGVKYRNAETLGYFVGGVYAGAASISRDVQRQRESVEAVLKGALEIVKAAPMSRPVGVAVSVSKEAVKSAIQGAIDDLGLTAAQMLDKAALPNTPLASAVKSAYRAGIDGVTRPNQR